MADEASRPRRSPAWTSGAGHRREPHRRRRAHPPVGARAPAIGTAAAPLPPADEASAAAAASLRLLTARAGESKREKAIAGGGPAAGRSAGGGGSLPSGALREKGQREERERATARMRARVSVAANWGVLFTRDQRRAVGCRSTAKIASGQIWPRRGRRFPAQAQVAAWARGGASGRPSWAKPRQRASARAALLDGPRGKEKKNRHRLG